MIRWSCSLLSLNYGAFRPSDTVGVKPVNKLIRNSFSALVTRDSGRFQTAATLPAACPMAKASSNTE